MIEYLKPILSLTGRLIKLFNIPIKQGGFKIKYPELMANWERGYLIFGKYELHERKLITKYIKPNDSVLELGACIGVVALTINKILSDKTKQVSIEPNPQMHDYLYKNKAANNGLFNIETCIVSKSSEVEFYVGGKAFLSSSTLSGDKKVTIPGKSLDDIINQYFPFTVLVMDIEGGELEFFRSFDLKSSNIRLVIWETHVLPNMLTKKELQECYDLLTAQGFSLKEKSRNVEAWIKN